MVEEMGRDCEKGERKKGDQEKGATDTESSCEGEEKDTEVFVCLYLAEAGMGEVEECGTCRCTLDYRARELHTYIRLLKYFVFLIFVSHVSKGHTAYNIHPSLF